MTKLYKDAAKAINEMKVKTIFLVNMFPKLIVAGGHSMKTFQNSQEFRFNANVLHSVVSVVLHM